MRSPPTRVQNLPDNGKILIATQHYPPDSSTTASYIGAIAEALAIDHKVVVLSGSTRAGSFVPKILPRAEVVEISNWNPPKHALILRAVAASLLTFRMSLATLIRAKRDDVVFSVTTPFTLPYAVILAAKLRGSATMLLIYDLYPEALEAAGLIRPSSLTSKIIRFANALLFRSLDTIVIVGRDVEPVLLSYNAVMQKKIQFIPNWTLLPIGHREVPANKRFRRGYGSCMVVGLSGNLGFTHCPRTVFEAARILADREDVHFLLSGWGIGWRELCELQATNKLANVTLLEPVAESELADFLASADVWIIPYRAGTASFSTPSRLYNLLAVGRPVIIAADRNSEAALVVRENCIGWVVQPEDPMQLAEAIVCAAADRAGTFGKGVRAAALSDKFSAKVALARYRQVVLGAMERLATQR